ncbi:hypothetical protein BDR06DRAFT_892287 [Suillus hirtellus]|nr:hypothetical protein BDR06DRAFT_892287 [Suillus hirtellus]
MHAILKALQNQKFPGQQVDHIYVNEAQDNLLIDVLGEHSSGLFWAGNTVQIISAGSSFRFNDLNAFVYCMEVSNHSSVTPAGAPVHQPTMFQLSINYRSHNGIVNCAHSVIELIMKFWPNAINHLQPEKGAVDGVKPVFFTHLDNDAHFKQFLVRER